eukprot:NODE_15903_length_1023_cov_2.693080.p1 GENE.NODE_15903_length_1023_cov_2.693080~~NODE_15903_length_1023_cov_2.693080.p1  ORF type:complete len:202 (+),score=36.34 NODE_15903_length_1023_cov_2.693080:188-793(+)
MRRILGEVACPVTQDGRYDYVLMGHSTGTLNCGFLVNDPISKYPQVLPSRLILVDPVAFMHHGLTYHALAAYSLEHVRALLDAGFPQVPRPLRRLVAMCLLHFLLRDEGTQQQSARWGSHDMFLRSPEVFGPCKVLTCISGADRLLTQGRSVREYLRTQLPEVNVRFDEALDHFSFVILWPPPTAARLAAIADFACGREHA